MQTESPPMRPVLRHGPCPGPPAGRGPSTALPPGAAPALPPAEAGRLHEYHAALQDVPAAAAAALLSAPGDPRPLAWLRTEAAERRTGRPHGPGLAELGLQPERLLLGLFADEQDLLKAAADLLKSGAVGAVLLELHGPCRRLDLTASRRLALAAASGRAVALLLRADALKADAAAPDGLRAAPSAAWRRWQVQSRPSRPLAADAPGAPAFALTLLRNRSGPAGARLSLDWQAGALGPRPAETRHAPLSRDPLPLPLHRPLAAGRAA